MRNAAIAELTELARDDQRIMLLTADLGFGVLDDFARELPDQFVNVGVTEQAMIGLATGMAEAGLRPYCYTIATFAMLRPFEFIRNGPVAHRLPVTILGIGAGTDYSHDGLTHYAVEDIALARSQPGMTIYSPVTDTDTRALVREGYAHPGVSYFRLSRRALTTPALDVRVERSGDTDVLVLGLGVAHHRAELIARAIADAGLASRALAVLRFDDQTAADLERHLARARVCVTVEDHYAKGGLGSAVAEVIATCGLGVPLVMDAVTSLPVGALGSADYVEAKLHRPVQDIADQAVNLLKISSPE
jgi:transketolase